jgi:hypothetical protein
MPRRDDGWRLSRRQTYSGGVGSSPDSNDPEFVLTSAHPGMKTATTSAVETTSAGVASNSSISLHPNVHFHFTPTRARN